MQGYFGQAGAEGLVEGDCRAHGEAAADEGEAEGLLGALGDGHAATAGDAFAWLEDDLRVRDVNFDQLYLIKKLLIWLSGWGIFPSFIGAIIIIASGIFAGPLIEIVRQALLTR